MGEIARFFGIVIAMYDDEHNPPHFHVRYAEQQVDSNQDVGNRTGPPFTSGAVAGARMVIATPEGTGRQLATHAAGPATEEDQAVELIGPGPYPSELIVTAVHYVRDYTIHVAFADGFERDIDLVGQLGREVFRPLRDIGLFRQVRFDQELETAVGAERRRPGARITALGAAPRRRL